MQPGETPEGRNPAGDRVLARPAVAAAIGGAVLVLLLFWPGVTTYDAVVQLIQGRAGRTHDHNPALVSRAWGLVDRVWPRAGPVFLFETALAWCGFALAVGSRHRGLRGAPLVLLLGLTPPVLAHLAQVGKDTLHVAGMSAAVGLLAWAERSGRRWALWCAAGPMFVAAVARYNGALALIPLGAWAGLIARDGHRPGAPPRRWVAGGVVAVLGISLAAWLGNRAATDVRMHIEQHLFMWDLAGISVRTGELVLPPHLARGPRPPTLAQVRRAYTPITSLPLTVLPEVAPLYPSTRDPGQLRALQGLWLRTIVRHPLAWAQHRLEVFQYLVGFYTGPNRTFEPVKTETLLAPPPGAAGMAVLQRLDAWRDGLLFRPWVWLLAAAALLARAWRRSPPDRAVMALCASALLYAAGYLLIAPAADMRYVLWSLLATALAAALACPEV